MNFAEIFNELQNCDETDRIEAKGASYGIGESFLASVSAFSNEPELGGGYILLGVSEDFEASNHKFSITGIDNPDKLQQQIASQCRELFNIPIRPLIKVIPHPLGKVVMVFIEEVSRHDKPVYIKKKGIEKGAFRRIGSSDQVCTREDINYFYRLHSEKNYDEVLIENASFSEFDPKAIEQYRNERKKVKPDAVELEYNDQDLMKALRALETNKGVTSPTVGGILLFGNQMVLRRLFPLKNHVDYILVEGREWVTDSERRYVAFEMCESLITGIPRLISQIMRDIPQVFALDEEEIRRIDNPLIPRKVIREAVVNALMHKDYTRANPTQIIKYSNRMEFRNAGYSLKPQEALGLPGSAQRNEILAQVFQDINYAEAKGTGISTMRDEMKKANLSIPLIESNRSANSFVLTLLPHHLFSKTDIEWLAQFKHFHLTDEEARTLIIVREKGSITNAEYRAINGVDTLTASSHLRRLRDLGLLESRGGGSATYYVPTTTLLVFSNQVASDISAGAGDISNSIKSAKHYPGINLSQKIKGKISAIGKRTEQGAINEIIKELCGEEFLNSAELGIVLGRNPKHLRKRYLLKLVASKELEYLYPEKPNHPHQAYKTRSK